MPSFDIRSLLGNGRLKNNYLAGPSRTHLRSFGFFSISAALSYTNLSWHDKCIDCFSWIFAQEGVVTVIKRAEERSISSWMRLSGVQGLFSVLMKVGCIPPVENEILALWVSQTIVFSRWSSFSFPWAVHTLSKFWSCTGTLTF